MEVLFATDVRLHGTGCEVVFAWDLNAMFVASTGSSRVVHVFDRRGDLVHQIVPPSPSQCTHLEWNKDGEVLAILQANSSVVVLWDIHTQKVQHIETGQKDLTILAWSKTSSKLAVGTSKGLLILYDNSNGVKKIVRGNSKKKISCANWSSTDEIVYGSEDNQLIVCSDDGKVIDQLKLKAKPLDIKFGERKGEEKEQIVSVNTSGKTILLYDVNGSNNTLELIFQPQYGEIVAYHWFGNGRIVAGFSSGYVVVISSDLKEIGEEQYCAKLHSRQLEGLEYNRLNDLIVSYGPDSLNLLRISSSATSTVVKELHKLVISESQTSTNSPAPSTTNTSPSLSSTSISSASYVIGSAEKNRMNIENTVGPIASCSFTNDGRILSISTYSGALVHYLITASPKGQSMLRNGQFVLWKEAFLTPLSPIAMVVTSCLVIVCWLVIGVYLCDVSFLDLIRAATGFCPGI